MKNKKVFEVKLLKHKIGTQNQRKFKKIEKVIKKNLKIPQENVRFVKTPLPIKQSDLQVNQEKKLKNSNKFKENLTISTKSSTPEESNMNQFTDSNSKIQRNQLLQTVLVSEFKKQARNIKQPSNAPSIKEMRKKSFLQRVESISSVLNREKTVNFSSQLIKVHSCNNDDEIQSSQMDEARQKNYLSEIKILSKAKTNLINNFHMKNINISLIPAKKLDILLEKQVGSLKVRSMLYQQDNQEEQITKNKINQLKLENQQINKQLKIFNQKDPDYFETISSFSPQKKKNDQIFESKAATPSFNRHATRLNEQSPSIYSSKADQDYKTEKIISQKNDNNNIDLETQRLLQDIQMLKIKGDRLNQQIKETSRKQYDKTAPSWEEQFDSLCVFQDRILRNQAIESDDIHHFDQFIDNRYNINTSTSRNSYSQSNNKSYTYSVPIPSDGQFSFQVQQQFNDQSGGNSPCKSSQISTSRI